MNLLKDDMNIKSISIRNKYNSKNLIDKNGIQHIFINLPFKKLFNLSFRFKILDSWVRAYKDWIISKEMFKEKNSFNSNIMEFMDIHSESYYFLKSKSYHSDLKVIIRSHTPWTLLRKYYENKERQNVDSKWAYQRESFCFKKCDIITTPSENLKINLIKIFNLDEKKIVVLPNIIDTDHFKPLQLKKKDGRFNILHVGRFNRGKGAITLIKAFIKLAKKYDDLFLVNVGKTDTNIYLKCKILLKKHNLEQRVSFENFVDYDDLPKFYGNSDVVIVPSELYESFSYTIAQGMSCGKIVIGSDIGGIPETLNYGKSGLLFKPGSTINLIEKIKEVYLKKINIKQFESEARVFILKNFSFNALKPKYLKFYKGQIKSKK
tara:strand:- start:12829 stop:13959 length:1131 start_codon:yes stop_codon:yes gene_type:complete